MHYENPDVNIYWANMCFISVRAEVFLIQCIQWFCDQLFHGIIQAIITSTARSNAEAGSKARKEGIYVAKSSFPLILNRLFACSVGQETSEVSIQSNILKCRSPKPWILMIKKGECNVSVIFIGDES